MATAPSNNSTAKVGTLGLTNSPMSSSAPKSQRGQNKPKCKQCGNVARSRCPYEQCKSCCSKNQNPCPIHVLKASTIPDNTPSSGAAPLDRKSFEPPPSISAGRAASLRQLSNSFAQFNNLHLSLRSKKPLTRKDAAAINEWRFSKLKEYKERNVDAENEAFDRYMQNVDLLEEVLSVKQSDEDVSSASEANQTSTENSEVMIPGLKLQLRSNSTRSDGVRIRIKKTVDDGLKKLKCAVDGDSNNEEIDEVSESSNKRKRTEKLSAISDLLDKINKARSEEDLQSCLEVKLQLFNSDEDSAMVQHTDNEMHQNQTAEGDAVPAKELDYSLPKLVGSSEIDQETLNIIDKHFSSLEYVEQL
ncbi:putative transcription factor STY-LRP1 family [Medicago truncatula]|uniref:Electron carrier/iron ion-binding protein, putative n=1 Tax=Medicago truncatula TaxID=3880 RepID=A0A072V0D3_MEDTR|nr:uncharacterized protein LOC25493568 isoform X1 [Medicago truncatula]KEH31585.1 electron carrier/iron ion-binding protein, putative [Medicago truncatula]RHN63154.1 putative transcription factor STY-LRP1 family [Medicago truncatula]